MKSNTHNISKERQFLCWKKVTRGVWKVAKSNNKVAKKLATQKLRCFAVYRDIKCVGENHAATHADN